jgi:hypothetical protein
MDWFDYVGSECGTPSGAPARPGKWWIRGIHQNIPFVGAQGKEGSALNHPLQDTHKA